MMMMMMRCNSAKYLRGTFLVTILLFVINAILFTFKPLNRYHHYYHHRQVPPMKKELNSSIPTPNEILHRNVHWQVHYSTALCPSNKTISQKYRECFVDDNKNKNIKSKKKNIKNNSNKKTNKSDTKNSNNNTRNISKNSNNDTRNNNNSTSNNNINTDIFSNKIILEEVVVYSGFYDDRPTPKGRRWVQVLGVVKMVPKPRPVYCQVWLKKVKEDRGRSSNIGEKEKLKLVEVEFNETFLKSHLDGTSDLPEWAVEVKAVAHTTGRNHNFHKLSYGQRQFSCPLDGLQESFLPTHVSLTFARGERSTIFLPVQYPVKMADDGGSEINKNKTMYEHEFVVCVTQAYGRLDPMELLEWVELHRMLGVTRINIYNGSLLHDASLDDVIEHYTDEGLLALRQIPPAVANESNTVESTKLSSPSSLNDCLLRHLHSSRWIVIVDFDEVILPSTADDYSSLMEQISRLERSPRSVRKPKSPPGSSRLRSGNLAKAENTSLNMFTSSSSSPPLSSSSSSSWSTLEVKNETGDDDVFLHHTYSFRMAYFFRHVKSNVSKETNETLFTGRFVHRTDPLPGHVSPKSMVDPRQCLSVFNHYCYIALDRRTHKRLNVDPQLALVRHYRKSCSLSKKWCASLEGGMVRDAGMDRFLERLKVKVEEVKSVVFDGSVTN